MSWDAEEWTRRFDNEAEHAQRYIREKRRLIGTNDPRAKSYEGEMDRSRAWSDLAEHLMGFTSTKETLRRAVETAKQSGPSPMPKDLFDAQRYRAEWGRRCDALLAQLA
jgi:hypothetical protein